MDLGRLKTASPLLSVATNPSVQGLGGRGSTSPMSGTPVPLPHSSPSSSQWSRRPLPAQSASSAPSSLFQVGLHLLLKTVAFIAGKKNPVVQKKIICFSIENLIANISFYVKLA